MKKSFAIMSLMAFIIVTLCIYYVKVNERGEKKEITLESAFGRSGAAIVSSEVYFWGQIKDRYKNIDDVYPIAEKIMSTLKVDKSRHFSENRIGNDTTEKIEINGTTEKGQALGITIHISKDITDINERYISIDIIKDLSYENMETTRLSVETILKSFGIEARTNTCITGTYNGKLEAEKLEAITSRILDKTEAKKVEGVNEKNYISVAAYSPYIETYINVNGKKVNLNLASRYNSYEDKTYIWLATPVITTEY